MSGEIQRAYLPVLRALRKTFVKDREAERQVVAAIRMSIAELQNNHVSAADIATELNLTEKMVRMNLAQVAYNQKLDSYAVKLTEEMVPSNGSVVDIKTPADLLQEQQVDLGSICGSAKREKHSV